jgi:hypothetical protein
MFRSNTVYAPPGLQSSSLGLGCVRSMRTSEGAPARWLRLLLPRRCDEATGVVVVVAVAGGGGGVGGGSSSSVAAQQRRRRWQGGAAQG